MDATTTVHQGRALWLSTIAFTVCFAVWTIFAIIGIQIKAGPRPQRNPVRPAGRHADPDRLADPPGARHLDRPVRRPRRLHAGDAVGGGRDLAADLRLRLSDSSCSRRSASASPAARSRSASPMSRGGIPKEKQGTALGIFGAGNVGAAVTKFVAPFVHGRLRLADGGAGLGGGHRRHGASSSGCSPKDDPDARARAARRGEKPTSAWLRARAAEERPGLALLALLFLRLRRLRRAGAVAAALPDRRLRPRHHDRRHDRRRCSRSRPASSAPMAGICPTGTARAASCTGPSWSSVVCTFMLSYPPTDYVVQGIDGPIAFSPGDGPRAASSVMVFVLGFFMSLGKAAVYKHIPVYYPNNVGAVGGLVGMIGGLGGFVLPIAFGALNDLTGIWTSCFMLLFVLVAGRAGLDARRDPADGARRRRRGARASCPSCRKCRRSTSPSMTARCRARCSRTGGRRTRTFWESDGPRHRAAQSLDLDPGAAAVLRGLDGLVGGRRQAAVGRLQVHHRPAVLARGAARPVRRDAAHLLLLHGADLRRPAVDHARDLVAADPGARHRLRGAEPDHALSRSSWRWRCCAASAAATSPPRWPTSPSSSRRRRRATRWRSTPASAISASASCSSWCRSSITAGVFGWLGGDPQTVTERSAARTAVAAERRLRLGAVHRRVGAFAAWFGMNDIASAKASFADQAVIFQRKHNWIMCWLYTGTFGSFIGYSAGFPLLAKTQFPAVNALQYAFLGPLVGALSRSATGWVSDRSAAGASPSGCSSLMMRRRRSASSTSSASRISRAPSGLLRDASCSCSSRPASATRRPSR